MSGAVNNDDRQLCQKNRKPVELARRKPAKPGPLEHRMMVQPQTEIMRNHIAITSEDSECIIVFK